jgi:hypothetical protein
MSTTAPARDTAPAEPLATLVASADPDIRTFRGSSLEELLPQIREQLGPDAVVLRQRDGLVGGIGGFFQQRFVEVDAISGFAHSPPSHRPRVDVYDEEPAAPATPEPAALPPVARPAEPFAVVLAAAATEAPAALDVRAIAPASTLIDELTRAGMSHAFAQRLSADAEAHELPFANGDLREATRRALARRLPTSLPHRAGGLVVAFAGPGSTACADALAAAYKRAGRDARTVASLDKARALLERGNPDALLALDLPPIASERAEVEALAERVATLQLDELLAVLPAELDLPSARALLDRLQPLTPSALALALDTPDAALGAALELACASRLPIVYLNDAHTGIAPTDPTRLAERLLP